MTNLPQNADLTRFNNDLLSGQAWNNNFNTVVSFQASGNYDANFGTCTAQKYFGDISNCTGSTNFDITMVAGEFLYGGSLIRQSGSLALLASASSAAGVTNIVGIALADTNIGESVTIRISGIVAGVYTGLIQGDTYWLSDISGITNVEPSTTEENIVVAGFAVTSTSLFISRFSNPTLYSPGFSGGGLTIYKNLTRSFSINSAGRPSFPIMPLGNVYAGGGQNIGDNVWTDLTFDSENFDQASEHSTSVNPARITISTTGIYTFSAHVNFTNNVNGIRGIRLMKNGVTQIGLEYDTIPSGAYNSSLLVPYSVMLTAGDYVTVQAYQNSGTTLATTAGANISWKLESATS